jgi:hypothetical protein
VVVAVDQMKDHIDKQLDVDGRSADSHLPPNSFLQTLRLLLLCAVRF